MIDLSIILISYNTKELTLDSLQSVFEQTTEITFEVIVLDNSFPQVKFIASKKNLGFA